MADALRQRSANLKSIMVNPIVLRQSGSMKRFDLSFVASVVAGCVLAVAAGAAVSQAFWNYPFEPPKPDERILRARAFTGVARFSSLPEGRSPSGWKVESAASLRTFASDSDSGVFGILDTVAQRGPIESLPVLSAARVEEVLGAFYRAGVLERPRPGYEEVQTMVGVVVEGVSASGKRLVFVGANGGEVFNDHHPAYLLLFEQPEGSPLRLLSHRLFFYDVAGLEGMTWWTIAIMLSPASVGILLVLRMRWQRRRARTQSLRSDTAALT